VAARVDKLLELGLIAPVNDATSTGGRPPSQFAFNPTARLVLAVDVGASHVAVALSDLTGKVLRSRRDSRPVAEGPVSILGLVVDTARTLLSDLNRDPTHLIAAGIGLPGPVEFATGRPISPPIMPGWDMFDVSGWVSAELGVPVYVDNDVNIMALGERSYSWPGVEHFLFIKVATGIGAGIISGGRLQRGAQGIAGDIGHVPVVRGADIICRCGNRGCLEAIASGTAVARDLRDVGIAATSSADVIELVKAGNVTAIDAVRQAGRDLGDVLTTCVSFINPEVIALGGSLSAAGEHLLAGVREVVYQRSMPLATERLQIVTARAGDKAGLIGASMLAIHYSLGPMAN
jgi:glucokinase